MKNTGLFEKIVAEITYYFYYKSKSKGWIMVKANKQTNNFNFYATIIGRRE